LSFVNNREERRRIRELVRESEISVYTFSRSSSWSNNRICFQAGKNVRNARLLDLYHIGSKFPSKKL
jgi:hypothetical protein